MRFPRHGGTSLPLRSSNDELKSHSTCPPSTSTRRVADTSGSSSSTNAPSSAESSTIISATGGRLNVAEHNKKTAKKARFAVPLEEKVQLLEQVTGSGSYSGSYTSSYSASSDTGDYSDATTTASSGSSSSDDSDREGSHHHHHHRSEDRFTKGGLEEARRGHTHRQRKQAHSHEGDRNDDGGTTANAKANPTKRLKERKQRAQSDKCSTPPPPPPPSKRSAPTEEREGRRHSRTRPLSPPSTSITTAAAAEVTEVVLSEISGSPHSARPSLVTKESGKHSALQTAQPPHSAQTAQSRWYAGANGKSSSSSRSDSSSSEHKYSDGKDDRCSCHSVSPPPSTLRSAELRPPPHVGEGARKGSSRSRHVDAHRSPHMVRKSENEKDEDDNTESVDLSRRARDNTVVPRSSSSFSFGSAPNNVVGLLSVSTPFTQPQQPPTPAGHNRSFRPLNFAMARTLPTTEKPTGLPAPLQSMLLTRRGSAFDGGEGTAGHGDRRAHEAVLFSPSVAVLHTTVNAIHTELVQDPPSPAELRRRQGEGLLPYPSQLTLQMVIERGPRTRRHPKLPTRSRNGQSVLDVSMSTGVLPHDLRYTAAESVTSAATDAGSPSSVARKARASAQPADREADHGKQALREAREATQGRGQRTPYYQARKQEKSVCAAGCRGWWSNLWRLLRGGGGGGCCCSSETLCSTAGHREEVEVRHKKQVEARNALRQHFNHAALRSHHVPLVPFKTTADLDALDHAPTVEEAAQYRFELEKSVPNVGRLPQSRRSVRPRRRTSYAYGRRAGAGPRGGGRSTFLQPTDPITYFASDPQEHVHLRLDPIPRDEVEPYT